MMFQMETHYFLSPFQCFCYFVEDDEEQLHLKSVLLLWDWPEGNHSFTRETLVPKAACLGGFYHTGSWACITPAPSGWQTGMFEIFWEDAPAERTCWMCPSLPSGWFSPLDLRPLFLWVSLPAVKKQNKQQKGQISYLKWSFLKTSVLEKSAS